MRVYERTTVESIDEQGAGVVVRANGTTLTARRVVLATSAYTHHLLPVDPAPLHPALRLHPGERAAHAGPVGAARLEGAAGDHRRPHLLQLLPPTADGRVLWGTSEADLLRRQPGRSPRAITHRTTTRRSRQSWRRHFPALAELEWPYRVGRRDLLDHPAHPVLRAGPRRPSLLWPGLHRSRTGEHAASRGGSWPIWRWTGRATCWISRW